MLAKPMLADSGMTGTLFDRMAETIPLMAVLLFGV